MSGEGNVSKENLDATAFVAHWRQSLIAANTQFGGIQWSVDSLFLVYGKFHKVRSSYIGINDPSPFKRCAAFAIAFMDEENHPLYGKLNKYPLYDQIKNFPRFSSAVLAFEYVKFCLHGAVLNKDNGETAVLTNPILISEHTFVDIIHAFSHLSQDGACAFHLLSLLFEQLAYQTNPTASYPRLI